MDFSSKFIRKTLAVERLLDFAAAVLAPSRCRFCQAPLFGHDNPYLCRACADAVEWVGAGACQGCGFPAGPHAAHGDSCWRCRGKKLQLTAAAAVARYRGGARSLVLALKFRGETEMAKPMAQLLAARWQSVGFGRADLLLPVVLHPQRRRARGFDQAGLLGARLSELIDVPSRPELLRRVRPTAPQTSLRRGDRIRNMAGAFQVTQPLTGQSVLLVDDVMTTGATLAECARACRDAGARRVYALVFAR